MEAHTYHPVNAMEAEKRTIIVGRAPTTVHIYTNIIPKNHTTLHIVLLCTEAKVESLQDSDYTEYSCKFKMYVLSLIYNKAIFGCFDCHLQKWRQI